MFRPTAMPPAGSAQIGVQHATIRILNEEIERVHTGGLLTAGPGAERWRKVPDKLGSKRRSRAGSDAFCSERVGIRREEQLSQLNHREVRR